ncbi:MAG: hypothetical protein KKE98_04670 [Nanoarchaeota archaeon]|nr:hypothetical protein [Nanoarchaeota archaeon]MBU1597708.1 hypothetical protein [Nanoarchaeota archaeon]
MVDYSELERNERRSITMPNSLWNELSKITNDIYLVSEYVRQAVLEKLKKDFPEKALYYEKIILGKNDI